MSRGFILNIFKLEETLRYAYHRLFRPNKKAYQQSVSSFLRQFILVIDEGGRIHRQPDLDLSTALDCVFPGCTDGLDYSVQVQNGGMLVWDATSPEKINVAARKYGSGTTKIIHGPAVWLPARLLKYYHLPVQIQERFMGENPVCIDESIPVAWLYTLPR